MTIKTNSWLWRPKMHVVLVEPEIPLTPYFRTCAVTGTIFILLSLWFFLDERHLKRAGLDYWRHLQLHTYPDLQVFFHLEGKSIWLFTTKGKRKYTDVKYQPDDYLLLAKKLPVCLTGFWTNIRKVPAHSHGQKYSLPQSFNSVAIVLYEALRQLGFPTWFKFRKSKV